MVNWFQRNNKFSLTKEKRSRKNGMEWKGMHRFPKNLVKETIVNIVIFYTTEIIINNNEEMVVYLFPIYLYSLCGVKYKKNSLQISRV